jgi:hypothetical protein
MEERGEILREGRRKGGRKWGRQDGRGSVMVGDKMEIF